jgi:hypothetical protein
MPYYQANRGGHAPGFLREAFCDYVDEWYTTDWETIIETVEVQGEPRPVKWLLGQLWNCTDCLPGGLVSQINEALESTHQELHRHSYSSAVRALAALER